MAELKYPVRHMWRGVFSIFVILSLVGCNAKSQEDFQQDGQRIAAALTKELHAIHTRDDLVKAQAKLTKLFDDLVDVAIAGRTYHYQHAWEEIPELSRQAEQVNVRLQVELSRVCRIEGGREILEKFQEPGLNRLDVFQKKLKVSRETR